MKHVPRPWLRRFQLVLVVLDAILLALYFYGRANGEHAASEAAHTASEGLHSHTSLDSQTLAYGISTVVAVLAGIHALYSLGLVWWLDKKKIWPAHAFGVALSGAMVVLLSSSDSPMHIFYHMLLVAFTFCAAMCGTLVVGLTVSFAFTMLIITSLGPSHLTSDPAGHVVEMILVVFAGISGTAGWYIFSKRYIQNTDPKALEALATLIKQERTTVSLILESITDGVMVINTDGLVPVLNESCARILGWPKEEAQNLQYDTLLQLAEAPDQKPGTSPLQPSSSSIIQLTASSAEPQHQVSLIKTRDGRQIYVDITASPISAEEHIGAKSAGKVVGVIVVIRDIDKQKREEQQRSEFISTASHEMRTPVAAIEGYLALALNPQVSQVDNKARSFLQKAHESTQHLGKLFQDLLTSAKAEDGRLVSHPKAVEMGQYLEQLVDNLRFTAEKKGLLLDLTVGSATNSQNGEVSGKVVKPLYYVNVDPDRLREVITNLFDNAVKYTSTGKISIGLTGNTDVVQFFIRDTGPGIPPADIPHLFQKFYRVDSSVTRTIGGTGLGLFICRKIVELYHGRIWVESEINQGSTFYINLPRLDAAKASELQAQEAQAQANSSPLDKS